MTAIKTPDQRVRVFISSTIRELAEERIAAQEAIQKLRLIPVLFELGARPHPPKELYRAYLDQSHIFVGIYWNSYGWVAPDMNISGLEDEYRLAASKPQLIYVKHPAGTRDSRLADLLLHIQNSNAACYRSFSSPGELKELLENDLAVLLSERFETEVAELASDTGVTPNFLVPSIQSRLIGRGDEMLLLKKMVMDPEVVLTTITGIGGTGKSRISISVAHELKESFPDGVYFVPLANVGDPSLAAATIAHSIGLFDNGRQDIKETLKEYLSDKQLLLVLDNLEQIPGAGLLISQLMDHCRRVKFLVTSRIPLHIRGEHIFPLSPLRSPDADHCLTDDAALIYPSVELFIQRAKEVNPSFSLGGENAAAICEICRRLDGLPLAIELAAYRSRIYSPTAILARLDRALDFLSRGPADLPDRQKTLRKTISWSYELLDEQGKTVFGALSVFQDGFTEEAAADVLKSILADDVSAMERLEPLIDAGLVNVFSFYNEASVKVEPRFTMLKTMQEFASDILQAGGNANVVKSAHATYYLNMLSDWENYLWESTDDTVLERLGKDYQNVRASFWYSLESEQVDQSWKFISLLVQFWVIRGWLSEGFRWIEAAQNMQVENQGHIKRMADFGIGILHYCVGNFQEANESLTNGISACVDHKDLRALARAKVFLGATHINMGDPSAGLLLGEGIELGRSIGDDYSVAVGSAILAEAFTAMGDFDKVEALIRECEELTRRKNNRMVLGLALNQKGNLNIVKDQLGEAEACYRESLGCFISTGFKSIRGWAHIGLAYCLMLKNQFDECRNEYMEAIHASRQTGEKAILLFGMYGLAGVAAATGNPEKAARLFGAGDELRRRLDYHLWSANKKLYKWVQDEIEKNLDDSSFENISNECASLTIEEMLQLVASTDSKQTTSAVPYSPSTSP